MRRRLGVRLDVRLGVLLAWLCCAGLGGAGLACAGESPEYRLKSAFLYNFARFTEWPPEVGSTLNLCIIAPDPFGKDIDALQGKLVGERSIAVQRRTGGQSLSACQIVFIGPAAMRGLAQVLDALRGKPVLIVADTAGATHQGVALNMTLTQDRISFEANQRAARSAGLDLSSQLLRLATEVIQ
jgi:hypothetical protein